MSTAVYGAGDGSVVWSALNHTTAASFGLCRHLVPGVSQLFSAILGVFGGGTAILGVFGGWTAQKRLDPNMRLCGQVVLSFELQPPTPLHHRLAVSQPFPSPKCKFSRVKHGKFCPCSMPKDSCIYTAVWVCTHAQLYPDTKFSWSTAVYSCTLDSWVGS
jgi:hypothetical protein